MIYLDRLKNEHSELASKLTLLDKFITTEAFLKLATAEAARLHLQSAIMRQYVDVLALRIAFAEESNDE